MNQTMLLESVVGLGNIEAYTHWVNQIPILAEKEEQKLATQFLEQGDLHAARQLVVAHLRFVVFIARGYNGYGLPQADLIQEGNIGLMKAVKRFNPALGVRLVSFAVHWIKAEIHEFILRNWRIVKIATTKAQRKLFFNLRSFKQRLGWFNRLEVDHVAKELGVEPKDVVEMEARLNAHDLSFDLPSDADEETQDIVPVQYLEQESDPLTFLEESDWSEQLKEKLLIALESLDPRSKNIIMQRWLAQKKATLQELAAQYGISLERIRQLEQSAMKKLKNAILVSA